MKRTFVILLFLFLLVLSPIILSRFGNQPIHAQPSDYPTNFVPVYLNLNESKSITVYLWNGLIMERWIVINQSGLARFTPGILVILESQYPFTINGTPAWYGNGTANPFYFYEFRANTSMTLNIDFLPKPLPNTPVGYVNLDSSTPVPANSSFSDIPTKPAYVINAASNAIIGVVNTSENNSMPSSDLSTGQPLIFLGILGIIIVLIFVALLTIRNN